MQKKPPPVRPTPRRALERQISTNPSALANELDAIAARCRALPVLDSRSAIEILGYDDCGFPH